MMFLSLFIGFPLLLLIGFLISMIIRKTSASGVKLMLLGISIMLVGGIIAVDPNSNLGGFEYLIVLIGLFISVGGFAKDN